MPASDDDERKKNSFALTVADVSAQLPGPGKEIAIAVNFNTAWVRGALAAVAIEADNLTEPGECKAALITYYRGLNTAESEVEATKALRQEVDAPKAALAGQIRAKEAAEAPFYRGGACFTHSLAACGVLTVALHSLYGHALKAS